MHNDTTRILLVDDNKTVRLFTKFLMETSELGKFRVFVCRNGANTLKLLERRATKISVVVLDVMLDDCDGLELFAELRRRAPALPVIVTSGIPQEHLVARFHGDEPEAFLMKPFGVEQLVSTVNKVLQTNSHGKGSFCELATTP